MCIINKLGRLLASILSHPSRPAFVLVGLVTLAAVGCTSPSHDGPTGKATINPSATSQSQPAEKSPITSVAPLTHKNRGLLLVRNFTVGPIAARGRYLVWEATSEEGYAVNALLERNVKTGAIRQLALNPDANDGLAITSKGIIYAAEAGDRSKLVVVDPGGGHRRILSDSLAAPFDVRGNTVAWAELDGQRLRVVVRNMRTAKQFVAMKVGCGSGTCYRIDRVTVASEGVVFDLGAIAQGRPSMIVRRGFRAHKPQIAKIRDDPQPDLARSSGGALYYWLLHGWMRWDFRQQHPHPARLRMTGPWPLDEEGRRLLLLGGDRCGQRAILRLRDGREIRPPAPASTPVSPRQFGPLCRTLTGYAWTGRRLLLAWSLIPKISLGSHSEVGLASMVTSTRIPR